MRRVSLSAWTDAYALAIIKRPRIVLLLTSVGCVALGALSALRVMSPASPFAYIGDASKGFDARGNRLAGELESTGRILERAQCDGDISGERDGRTYARWAGWDDFVFERTYCRDPDRTYFDRRRLAEGPANGHDEGLPVAARSPPGAHRPPGRGRRLGSASDVSEGMCNYGWQLQRMWYWSTSVVFEPADESVDLFSLEPILGMCEVDDIIRTYDPEAFSRHCLTPPGRREFVCEEDQCAGDEWDLAEGEATCCPSRSLGTWVAHLRGRSTCADITADDVAVVKARVSKCASQYYPSSNKERLGACADPHNDDGWALCEPGWEAGVNNTKDENGTLIGDGKPLDSVSECHEGNAVWDIYTALVDIGYFDPKNKTRDTPRFARLLVPGNDWNAGFAYNIRMDALLRPLVGESFGGARVAAFDNSVKFAMFSVLLVSVDTPLIMGGTGFIFIVMWLYAGSAFVAGMAMVQLLLSILMGIFFFLVVLWLPFFPFLNTTAIFICIGIAADDVFVFLEAFDHATRAAEAGDPKLAPGSNAYEAALLSKVLKDAGGATLITSLTTAGAFFATSISDVTSIRCFGLFCGLVVLSDWILLVTYIPAVVTVYKKHIHGTACGRAACAPCAPFAPCTRHIQTNQPFGAPGAVSAEDEEPRVLRPLSDHFDAVLSPLITHRYLRYAWIVALLALSGGLTYFAPSLSFPTSGQLQMLPADHPIERMCCVGPKYGDEFTLGGIDQCRRMDAWIHWGLVPEDNGNVYDPSPNGVGTLQLLPIDPTTEAAQLWLRKLCRRAKRAAWYDRGDDPDCDDEKDFQCHLERVVEALEAPCGSTNLTEPCCGKSKSAFPYPPSTFNECLGEYQRATGDLGAFWPRGEGTRQNKPVVYRLRFPSRRVYKETHAVMSAFREELLAWADEALAEAPEELAGGFVTSPWFNFLALLSAIGESAFQSSVLAAALAGLVILTLTANVIIASFATVTIALVISTIFGILVLNGWSLGVLESICFATGIGMACDFVAHLGYAYRQGNLNREADTRDGLVRITIGHMAPATSAAAFSTSVMGVFMLFSATQFTRNFGQFILLLMSFSWVYAFFLLLPVLSVAGPLGRAGELSVLVDLCRGGAPQRSTQDASAKADSDEGPAAARAQS